MAVTTFVYEPDADDRRRIESVLAPVAETVIFIDRTSALLALLPARDDDLLVACVGADESAALELVRELRQRGAMLPVLMIGPHTAFRTAVELARLQATDFLERPFSARQLRSAVRKVCQAGR